MRGRGNIGVKAPSLDWVFFKLERQVPLKSLTDFGIAIGQSIWIIEIR